MTDMVTFVLPTHTKENPSVVTETIQDAISKAFHVSWWRYSAATPMDKKDKDAGKNLSRNRGTR